MTIYIIRHSETEYNIKGLIQGWSDSPLTEKGKLDAENVAKSIKLRNEPVIVSSDLGRAIATAHIIRETLGVKDNIIPDFNLRERRFGPYERKPINEIYNSVTKILLEKSPRGIYVAEIPGVEPIVDIKKRLEKVIPNIVNHININSHDIIIVGHCLSNNYLREVNNPEGFYFYDGREALELRL